MRASGHNGRTSQKGTPFKASHNDRDFDTTKASHIDSDKTKDNVIIKTFEADKDMTLEEYEKYMYQVYFKDGQEAKNARYKAQGHAEKMKSVEELYTDKRKCPEERIVQLGKGKEVDRDKFEEVAKDYVRAFNKKWGSNIKIMDISFHYDESAWHAHIRRFYMTEDKDGNLIPSEAGALRELGIERPNLEAKEGRYNNAKISFTEMDRALFLEVCQEHGIEVETEPIHGQKRKSKIEHEIEEAKMELKEVLEEVTEMKSKAQTLKDVLKELKNLNIMLQVAKWLRKEEPQMFEAIKNEIKEEIEDGMEVGRIKKENIEH